MPGAGWSAEGLARLLADSSTLYIKTHGFHWHVTGPMFNTLHLMFMDQYTELWHSLNLIAERIRAPGHPAPGSYAPFASLSSIPEETGVPPATVMIQQLIAGQESVVRTARGLFPLMDKADDEPTAEDGLDAAEPAGDRRTRDPGGQRAPKETLSQAPSPAHIKTGAKLRH